MAVLWTLVHLLALVSIAMAGEFLTCPADQTEVKTPYIYDNSIKHADCPALIGAYVDWYQFDYRAECQRWMDLATPPAQVEKAYISECYKYANGTLRYRAEVCCPGAVQATRCFTCTNATDQYSCNYHGTVETCATGQVCSTVFNYYGSNGQYCSRYITKGCMADQTCSALVDENPAKCKSYVDDPRCAYCYDETFGNWPTSASHTYFYCGSNPCNPNPCTYGYCVVNSTLPSGYYCTCQAYSWLDNNGHCSGHVCSPNPCQNQGRCSLRSSPSPYYKCCCRQGWTGYNCSQAVSTACTSNPGYCKNGGTCYDYGTLGLRCKCPTGWVGEQCEINSEVTCTGGPSALYVVSSWYNSWSSVTNCSSYKFYDSYFISQCPARMKRPDGPLFKNGVHGLVTKTELRGLQSCVAGETCFSFKAQACCPTCMSAPCLNGGWCVQKTNHDYVCKCRFGYEGKNCENKVAMCVSSGDPHYQTFDDSLYHFQGTCLYNMATPSQEYPDLTYFQVLTKNEHRYGNTQVSYPKYFEVRVFGQKIRLDKGKRAYVNGAEVFPDVSYPGFKITNNGNFLRLETNFSLVVEYDGNWIGIIKLPEEYRDKMGGLCADFNGDPSNDYTTCTGIDVSDSPTRSSEIGDSCAVDDTSDPNCVTNIVNETVCDPATKAELQTNQYCGYINANPGPFAACIAADPTTAAHALENCVMDTCMVKHRNTSCRSMEAFVTVCRNKGYGPPDTWRVTVNCPMTCSAGMTYYASTYACHATCANPLAETECGLPDTESCKCPNGTVLHQGTCQDPSVCGCLSLACPDGQKCRIVNGKAECYDDIPIANWGPWGEWGDCSLPYWQGMRKRTRKCDNPAPSAGGLPCPGSNSDSENCVCPKFVAADDCKKCDETNNPAGYLPDSCSCDHYYQCFKSNGLWSRAILRECAPCTCWDQNKLTCVRDQSKSLEDCPAEPIIEEELESDGVVCTLGSNTYRAVANDIFSYEWFLSALNSWTKMPCAPGTVFDAHQCRCVFGSIVGAPVKAVFCLTFEEGFSASTGLFFDADNVELVDGGLSGKAGKFNGQNSRIEIPYFTNNELGQFTFSLWFKRIGDGGEQGLVYNGDCDEEGSIQIRSESSGTVGAGIWADDDLRNAFSGVQVTGNQWHHVALTYDGADVKFYVDKVQVNTQATSGLTRANQCPLVLGFKYGAGYFNGLMDEICFFKEALTTVEVEKLYDAVLAPNANN